ncbi:MAG TPA: histidine kinase, partial [Thermoanaerobaculia bacterium]
AVFAVSALHLSHAEVGHESWVIEVIGHHSSIALIFAILYLDFRFALADLFLRRAISLFALVAIAAGLYFLVEIPVLSQHDFRSDPVAVGISVIIWVLLALSYPVLQRLSSRIVDRLVLRRVDYALLRENVAQQVANADSESTVLDALTAALREPLSAARIEWTNAADAADPNDFRVAVPTTELPRYAMTVGPLAAGRRLLSDESAMLHDVALMAARRIDALRLSRERYQRSLREQEISKLATEAELRALRAQVNPHFLFNALNTIGYLIQTAPTRAHATLMKLTALLRGVLRTGDGLTPLGDEIDLVAAYLDIEHARFEERLRVTINVGDDLRELRVPPLILQPLVENAIKHGVARNRAGGEIGISAALIGDSISLKVRNTGSTATELEIAQGRRHGVGLANLDERLKKYHSGARLMLRANGDETVAEVIVPVAVA